MKTLIRSIGKLCIVAFVLWHAFAVAVYSVPRDAKDATGTWIREELLPVTTPYMLASSQWQLWNLFSPDPLRRVTYYHLQREDGGRWTDIETIRPGSYSVWRHAARFKMLINMFDEFDENKKAGVIGYLQYLCKQHGIPDGTPVRVRYEYYVIPKNDRPMPVSWWKEWLPVKEIYDGPSTACLS